MLVFDFSEQRINFTGNLFWTIVEKRREGIDSDIE
jgi:hypothetical protein